MLDALAPSAQRIADFIQPELGPGEEVEAVLDRGRAGPPDWSGQGPFIGNLAGLFLWVLFWAIAMLVSALRYRTVATRWYAVVVTPQRVFFVRLRSVPKAPEHPGLFGIGRPAILKVRRPLLRREGSAEGGKEADVRPDMEPQSVEWVDARTAVSVSEIRFSGLSGLLRLVRPEGRLELSFDRAGRTGAEAVAIALGAPPAAVLAGTPTRRALALAVDFGLGFSLLGGVTIAFYLLRDGGVASLVVIAGLVVVRLALGRPYATAWDVFAVIAGLLAGFIAIGLLAVAVGF